MSTSSAKRSSVSELGFLTLVEVGPPNNNYAAFVGRFNDYIFAFF